MARSRSHPGWEHFAHVADIGVRGFGATKAEAFQNAALAMIAALVDPAAVAQETRIAIECRATDDDLLLYEWLNAVIFEMATRKMLFSRFEVSIAGHRLTGSAWGERIDPARHQPAAEAKGATLTALRVNPPVSPLAEDKPAGNGLWSAQCVVDV